jgi:hypothetical protein
MILGSPRTLKILFAAWIGVDELSGATQDSGLCLDGKRTGEGAEKLDRGQVKPRPSYIFHKYRITFKEEWKLKPFLL